MEISENTQKYLLSAVRETIAGNLNIPYKKSESADDPVLHEKLGAFVTLHLHGQLRGCIGYIVGILPLLDTIREMADAAAFRDPRFSPLSADEFAQIDVEISVLSPIVPLESYEDIIIGKTGLIARKGGRSGLLLPQVASEYGWSKDEFLSHTCMKAGLQPGAWKDNSVSFEMFSAFVFGEKTTVKD